MIVIVNLDSGTQDFQRVVSERVQDQIDGIRKLIEDATHSERPMLIVLTPSVPRVGSN